MCSETRDDNSGLHFISQRRCVMPLVTLQNLSGNTLSKVGIVCVRSNDECKVQPNNVRTSEVNNDSTEAWNTILNKNYLVVGNPTVWKVTNAIDGKHT